MSAGDTARAYYVALRGELNQHLAIAHQTLYLYLGAVTALFGTTLTIDGKQEILMIVPFLSLGASVIISHHERVTGTIAAYCAKELDGFLHEIGEHAPQWDNSHALDIYQKDLLLTRLWGNSLIIILPALIATIINWRFAIVFPGAMSWWLGIILEILSFSALLRTFRYRQKIKTWSRPRRKG